MTDPIDTDTNSKPQPEAGKPKGGRKPAKKAKTAKNAAPANKSARKPKADPYEQEGRSDRDDAEGQGRDT